MGKKHKKRQQLIDNWSDDDEAFVDPLKNIEEPVVNIIEPTKKQKKT